MTTQIPAPTTYPWPDGVPSGALRPLNEVHEVAAYLRCGRTHVFHLLKSGELQSVKVGRKRLIPADAVHAYVSRAAAVQASQ